jgi:hypothetical protein
MKKLFKESKLCYTLLGALSTKLDLLKARSKEFDAFLNRPV